MGCWAMSGSVACPLEFCVGCGTDVVLFPLLFIFDVGRELLKQERAFSRYRELKALIVSWNIDSARPDALNTGSQANVTFLTDVLRSIDHDHDGGDGGPDIIAFGLQEVIDLESRKMAAKSMLLAQNHAGHTGNGRKKHHKHHKHDVVDWDDDDDGDGAGQELAEHVSSAYRKWNDAIVAAVRAVHGRDVAWHVQTGALVGLFSCVLVRRASARGGAGEAGMMDLTVAKVKRGMGGRHGNKVLLFVFGGCEWSANCFGL
jgi:hypothetical protein